jgi:hypothetical protein
MVEEIANLIEIPKSYKVTKTDWKLRKLGVIGWAG